MSSELKDSTTENMVIKVNNLEQTVNKLTSMFEIQKDINDKLQQRVSQTRLDNNDYYENIYTEVTKKFEVQKNINGKLQQELTKIKYGNNSIKEENVSTNVITQIIDNYEKQVNDLKNKIKELEEEINDLQMTSALDNDKSNFK
jgi:DNA repair ATPase RecN